MKTYPTSSEQLWKQVVKCYVFDERGYVLGIVRAMKDDKRAGEFDVPGGGVEPGETNESAAVRELRTETGLVVHESKLHHVDTVISPSKSGGFNVIDKYQTSVLSSAEKLLDHDCGEVEDAFFMPPVELVVGLAHELQQAELEAFLLGSSWVSDSATWAADKQQLLAA